MVNGHAHWTELVSVAKLGNTRQTSISAPEGAIDSHGASRGNSNADAVARYIADQDEHHRRKTFQEEFLEYLKKHEIEYDERYIWE